MVRSIEMPTEPVGVFQLIGILVGLLKRELSLAVGVPVTLRAVKGDMMVIVEGWM